MTLPFRPPLFGRFADSIRSLPPLARYGHEHLCTATFRLYSDRRIELFYAPFDFVNKLAKVAVIGITPGFQQMEIAFRAARTALVSGKTDVEASRQAKAAAAFAGRMRRNLISMLGDIRLHRWLGLPDPASLFSGHLSLVHTTSAIRYPVFVHGANYTGHAPPILRHPVLRAIVFEVLCPELAEVPGALLIPLGKAVEECLCALVSAGLLGRERCLLGFPHPGGGNGHRIGQFELNMDRLKTEAAGWFRRAAGAASA